MNNIKFFMLLSLLTASINASQLSQVPVSAQEEDPNLQIRFSKEVFDLLELQYKIAPYSEGEYYVTVRSGNTYSVCKYMGIGKHTRAPIFYLDNNRSKPGGHVYAIDGGLEALKARIGALRAIEPAQLDEPIA